MNYDHKIVEFNADIPTLWKLQCRNLYNSKNLAALAVRECVQNSIDSIQQALKCGKISHGRIEIEYADDTLSVTDNGMGMDIETLHTKFLTLGGTTKGDEDSTGGFGLAKSVILGCGTGFKVHTQDNEFSSDDLGINPIHKTTYLNGTQITMVHPQVDGPGFKNAILDYVYSSIIPNNITVTFNGIEHEYQFTPTNTSKRMPVELGISNVMIPKDTLLELNVFKTKTSVHYLYVRLRGLTQFKTYLSWNANCDITLDFQTTLDPRSNEYPFSTNREGLKAAYQGIVEAIRDKVSQSPTSIAQDDKFKETLYDNVSQNEVAARNFATVVTNKQVMETVKSIQNTVQNIDGFTPQGGYVPTTVLDYVSSIQETAKHYNTTPSQIIQQVQPKTLFQLNNPLAYSWIIYDDTQYPHKKIPQSTVVSMVVVWDTVLRLMTSMVDYLLDDKVFYPGVVFQQNTNGMCLEKTIFPNENQPERRCYIMINPLEIPSGTPMKIALYLMGVASHELAHLICGSFEAHGEAHSYTRELIMNSNLDHVMDVIALVKSSKFHKLVGQVHSQSSPFKNMDLNELMEVASEHNVDVQQLVNKYTHPQILRMRLIMALKT